MSAGKFIATSRGYRSFEPDPFPIMPDLSPQIYRTFERAVGALGTLNSLELVLPNLDLLIRPYALKEALLSSEIEGTQSTLSEVMAEKSDSPKNVNIREVKNYERAMRFGVDNILSEKGLPLSLRLIKELHSILMRDVRGGEPQKTPGEFRRSQNWIGGKDIQTAAFVPCSPETLAAHLDNFEKAMYEDDLPDLIKAALLHYQFETIHPFNDGNGRIGRMLITLFLIDRKVLKRPMLYLSLYFKQYKTQYYDVLTYVRQTGDYGRWIQFFLEGVIQVAEAIGRTTKSILTLKETLKHETKDPYNLIDCFFEDPFVEAEKIKDYTQTSIKTAYKLLDSFVENGILVQITQGKRNRVFCFQRYLDLLNDTTLENTEE